VAISVSQWRRVLGEPKVHALYFSTFGHIEAIAQAIAEGLRGGDGPRQPSENELAAAGHQGRAYSTAKKLFGASILADFTMTTAVDLVQPHSQNAALARRAKHMVHMMHMASQGLCKVPHHNSSRPGELTLSDHSEMLPEAINTRLPRWRR